MRARISTKVCRRLVIVLAVLCAPAALITQRLARTGVPEAGSKPKAATEVAGRAAPGFDLGAVMRQVHFAFRSTGEGFSGGHSTYGVEVSRGELRFRPVHHPRGPAASPVVGGALRLRTTSIRRGGAVLPVGRTARLAADASLAISHGATVEEIQNREEGVEQRWRFRSQPRGDGPLQIRVQTAGLAFAGTTGNGLHFADSRSGLGVRYGAATWVDARGQRSPVVARYSDGAILLEVPAAVLARSSYPAVLDPLIGPETGMDTPVYGPPTKLQLQPALAFGGGNYLVVWHDTRGAAPDIHATRVSAAGVVLDPMGISLSKAAGAQQNPVLASDGSQFLVVWEDTRGGGSDIYGVRVGFDGKVKDTDAIAVSGFAAEQQRPTICFTGTNFLVAWQDKRNPSWDIYAARVSSAGAVIDTAGIAISNVVGDQQAPAVAFDGTNALIVWQDKRSASDWDIFGARLTPAGSVLDATGFPVAQVTNDQTEPAIAFGGGNYLVAWEDSRDPTTKWDIFGTRVTPQAGILDPLGIAVSKYDQDTHEQREPALAFDGTSFLAVWHDSRTSDKFDIYGARVSGQGAVLDSPSFIISAQACMQTVPAVAFGATSYLVVWEDARSDAGTVLVSSSSDNIYGAIVEKSGLVSASAGDIPISLDLNAQDQPALAFDGVNYLAVWADYRTSAVGPGKDIYGVRIQPNGKVIDTAGIAISMAMNDQVHPAVAFGGADYLVVWSDARASAPNSVTWDIYGARVTPAGVVLDTNGISVCNAEKEQVAPSVASDGSKFLVAWQDRRVAGDGDIYGARVSPQGSVLDTAGMPISTAPNAQDHPAVAAGGGNFFIVWQDRRSGNWDIYGARISGVGALLDPTGLIVSISSNDQLAPSQAWDGLQFVVAWQDKRSGTSWDIYAARVTPAGVLQDPVGLVIVDQAADQIAPVVAFEGSHRVFAWQDKRGASWDIFAARTDASLVVVDKAGFLAAGDAADELYPAIASDGDGHVLAAFYRLDSVSPYGTDRVKVRLITTRAGNGNACQIGADCKSTFCVDAVCCNDGCGGGATGDCMACAISAGAAVDGVCGTVGSGRVCRPAAGLCDVAESCDGSAQSCPADLFQSPSKECRPSVGECDVAESCSGSGATCPSNSFVTNGKLCNSGAGVCMDGYCLFKTEAGVIIGKEAGPPPDGQILAKEAGKPRDARDEARDRMPLDHLQVDRAATDLWWWNSQPPETPGDIGCRCELDGEGGGEGMLLVLIGLALIGWRRRRSRC